MATVLRKVYLRPLFFFLPTARPVDDPPVPEEEISDCEDVFRVGGELLEQDEELRLHILGVRSFFTKSDSEFQLRCK